MQVLPNGDAIAGALLMTDQLFEPFNMVVETTRANFDERAYLASNPDVANIVSEGGFESGWQHFCLHGEREGRKYTLDEKLLGERRRRKLERIRPFLRSDMPMTEDDGRLNFLTEALRKETRIVDTSNVSSNSYDMAVREMIKRHEGGLVLDCGAGRRDVYYPNVYNLEIVAYDTTDIISVGESLPFEDNTFSAILSIAVLEHVRDPFVCAREIARVLRPGGELFCAVPFLQPLHGYPHHYYNATHQGIRRLFEDYLDIKQVYVPYVGHPAFALHWFLSSWSAGLSADIKEHFLDQTIGSLLGKGPSGIAAETYGELPSIVQRELASAFVLTAEKAIRKPGLTRGDEWI